MAAIKIVLVTPAEVAAIAMKYHLSPLSDYQGFAQELIEFFKGKESGQSLDSERPVPELIRDPAVTPDSP